MSTEVVRRCDQCGEDGALEFRYLEDRDMGPSGSMENNYGFIDLCHKHAMAMLTQMNKHLARHPLLSLIEEAKREGKAIKS